MKKRVRAIIIDNNKVLLMHRIKQNHEYWTFPGGGVDECDKSIEEGLKRECKEELGVDIEVKDFVVEIPSLAPNSFGQMESFYKCCIVSGEVGTGLGPEFNRDEEKYGSYKVEWLLIKDIKNKNVYPLELRDKIQNYE